MKYCFFFEVLGSGSAQGNQTCHASGVCELIPELYLKDETLICSSASLTKVLRQHSHSNCHQDIP